MEGAFASGDEVGGLDSLGPASLIHIGKDLRSGVGGVAHGAPVRPERDAALSARLSANRATVMP